ncbi:hypothetical protein BS78_02G039500 [Paspalum vaginatum]|nr:hypothetical protein BS78_02G039500 [Paspalum vaginatum]KAJ1287815.1 hypothetical protein BS78_02G039500 [Paspalum vaginatum]
MPPPHAILPRHIVRAKPRAHDALTAVAASTPATPTNPVLTCTGSTSTPRSPPILVISATKDPVLRAAGELSLLLPPPTNLRPCNGGGGLGVTRHGAHRTLVRPNAEVLLKFFLAHESYPPRPMLNPSQSQGTGAAPSSRPAAATPRPARTTQAARRPAARRPPRLAGSAPPSLPLRPSAALRSGSKMASAGLKPGVPVILRELEPSSEFFKQGASVRVTGRYYV